MLARQMTKVLQKVEYEVIGDNMRNVSKETGNMYRGPSWFTESANSSNYFGIYK